MKSAKRKRKSLLCFMLIVTTVFVCIACQPQGESGGTGGSETINRLKAQGGPVTAAAYPMLVALANVAERRVENLQITVSPGGGAIDGLVLLGTDETDLTTGPAGMALDVYKGKNKDIPKDEGLRAIALAGESLGHLAVLKGSGIKTIEDLRGKKVHMTPGSAAMSVLENYLDYVGILEDVKVNLMSTGDAVSALQDRHIDSVWFHSRVPVSGISELATTNDILLLDLVTPVKGTDYFNIFPEYEGVIPAGSYPNQDYDVTTIVSASLLITREEVDEEIIYQLTKAIFEPESLEELIAQSASLSVLKNIDNPTKGIPIPLHPGAEKFYREMGYEILAPSVDEM